MSVPGFLTQNIPFRIIEELPYPEEPWRFSPSLQERLEETTKTGALFYKKCVVLPSDPEWRFVWESFHRQKPTTWGIKQIYCVYRAELLQRFKLHLSENELCAEDGTFQPRWPQEADKEERAKVMERADQILSPQLSSKKVYLLPLWHGSSEENISKICKLGFQIRGRDNTDPGFFGRGIYFTTSARNAVDVYSKDGHVLFSWASMRAPYPVIFDDHKNNRLLGKGARDDHDAHYIPVISAKPEDPFHLFYEPARPEQSPMCDEFVVFNSSQTLPVFWVELQPDLPLSPSNIPLLAERVLHFVVNVIRQEHPEKGTVDRRGFKEKTRTLLKALAVMVRNGSYPPEAECALLMQRYAETGPFFTGRNPAISYVECCREALSSWKSAFASQQLLTAFPTILEQLMPEEGWVTGCELLLTLLGCNKQQTSISTLTFLKRFVEQKRKVSFIEFAMELVIASKNEEEVAHYSSLIEGMAAYLVEKNALHEEHERVYQSLSTKEILEPLKECYLRGITSGALFDKLALIPNKNGYRQKMRAEQEALIQQVEAITQQERTAVKVTSPFLVEERYLKQDIINSILDLQGDIKTDPKYRANPQNGELGSSHPVCHLEGSGFNLHLKQKPTHPMQEYAIYNLTLRVAGKGVPPSFLVRFDVELPGKKKNSYPVLVSQTVVGTNLREFIKTNNRWIDKSHLTQMQLLGLITRPGDGRSSNYIVTEEGVIYCVDNDASFVEPIVDELFGWRTVNFKSVLYCFNDDALEHDVLEQWTKLSPYLLFEDWIKDLVLREKSYASLFEKQEVEVLYKEKLSFTTNLVLAAGTISTLYNQLCLLQKVLKEMPPQRGLDLLKHLITLKGRSMETNALGPRLHKFYSDAYKIKSTPSERLQSATGTKMASLTPAEAHKAGIGKVPTVEEIKEYGRYSVQMLQNEFRAFAFKSLLEQAGAFATETDERLAIHCDFNSITLEDGSPDLERQKLMLRGLQQWILLSQRRPESITLLGCSALTGNELIPFLHKDLAYLDIRGAAIESMPLEIQECQLKELNFSGCPMLYSFTLVGYLYNSPLVLPFLKRLQSSGCESLAAVGLEAPLLQEWIARDNQKLALVTLSASLLATVDFTNTPQVDVKRIVKASFPELFERGLSYEVYREIGSYFFNYLSDFNPPFKGLVLGDVFIELLQIEGRCHFELVGGFSPSRLVMNFTDGDKGVKALAAVLPQTEVMQLRLNQNNIGDEGAIALATALPKTSISMLSLFGNKIETRGAEAIIEIMHKTKVVQVNLGGNPIKGIIKDILRMKAPAGTTLYL